MITILFRLKFFIVSQNYALWLVTVGLNFTEESNMLRVTIFIELIMRFKIILQLFNSHVNVYYGLSELIIISSVDKFKLNR